MQTIIGAGGAIGTELAKALTSYTDAIRLVSRTPVKVNPGDELFSADVTNPEEALNAIEGSLVVYVTVGLPYKTKTWEALWPQVIKNVIAGCRRHEARLVFFDNVYLYDQNHLNPMTEETSVNPSSKKGKVRAELVEMILDEVRNQKLEALIARAADFYGPSIDTSLLVETVFKNFAKGKKAYWMGSPEFRHTFTYTPDAAAATALLGNTDDAYNQTWHLPSSPALTGHKWVQAIASEMQVEPNVQAVPKFLIRLMGLFNPLMREMTEMMYQYDRDYVFDSSKFQKRFDMRATPYEDAIRTIVDADFRTLNKVAHL